MRITSRPLAAKVVAGTAMALLLVSACASKKSTPAAAGGSTAAGGAGSAASVMTASGSLGTILTDAKGQTLYLFAADTSNVSTCNGQCAQYWPPLVTTGTPQAGGSAASSKLGTSKRKDGTTQVTYGGHPLYRYASDKKPGDTTGQGLDLSGGKWWVVGVDGAMITGGPGGGSASPSASAGYSRGY